MPRSSCVLAKRNLLRLFDVNPSELGGIPGLGAQCSSVFEFVLAFDAVAAAPAS